LEHGDNFSRAKVIVTTRLGTGLPLAELKFS
jgi:hypothetical protein